MQEEYNTQNNVSPLALDMNRRGNLDFTDNQTGIETSGAYDKNIYFDIDNDGFAERVGWVSANDGMIAFQKLALEVANDNYVSVEVKRYA